ncbi:glutathione S-transferase family protein [Actinocrispum wychmicini]|uniref:Putative glutathione S-transferase n=1 Tax=Actinocrispum wychmicini TaxID=1213861 RepID=A0A4R2JG25_9PSEU|nr:glutathione S-transferase C-terminal domain-containing protein [Actinocrispum wychmicini]TCO58721.1 putative glutathione S-transferase [Actinocrispum wychmicini]
MAGTQSGGKEISVGGELRRQPNRFTDRITPDGTWPVEPGRYRLIVSLACPWAHRSIIVRGLLGLQDVISMGVVDPLRDDTGWRFTLDEGDQDPVLKIKYLSEAYLATDPTYDRRVTVPSIVDVPSGKVVTNDFPQITRDLHTEWRAFHRAGAPDLYPEAMRDEIEAVAEPIYRNINNGVYRCGFATTQEAYDNAYTDLWDELDRVSARLESRRYLMGDRITEADIRLFPTLVRFDAVYHGHFKCNRQKLTEMPVLWAYARDLFQTPGFGDTVDWDHIKRHYYVTHRHLNPSGVVPQGPDPSVWNEPHNRA